MYMTDLIKIDCILDAEKVSGIFRKKIRLGARKDVSKKCFKPQRTAVFETIILIYTMFNSSSFDEGERKICTIGWEKLFISKKTSEYININIRY